MTVENRKNVSSETLDILARNRRFIPGGTASVARHVDPPIVFAAARDGELIDIEGRRYIDLNCAFGAILLGHNNEAQQARIADLTYGIDLVGLGTTELEGLLAERICEHVPCADMAMFCCSGTEATYHAIRLSRAATGRTKIVKFHGAYHGWHDYVAKNHLGDEAGPGSFDSAGILPAARDATIVLPLHDEALLEETLRTHRDEIAAVLLEPLMHNIGHIEMQPGFLNTLRQLTEELDIVLIFDEVITGFRHGLGGFQKICGVTPDLGTFGKALGNGYPVSLLAGRADLMQRFNPRDKGGDVLFGGTYNAHPLAMAASLAVIEQMEAPESYPHLYALGDRLRAGLAHAAESAGVNMSVGGHGSVTSFQFDVGPADTFGALTGFNAKRDLAFRQGLLARGIAVSTTPLRRVHFSHAHTEAQVDKVIAAAQDSLQSIAKNEDQVA